MPHVEKQKKSWTSPHGRALPQDFAERTLLMGIVNATPDSFSDGGKFLAPEAAANHAEALVRAGADIIDLGAESTRPGAEKIDTEEELKRMIPALRAIRERLPNVPVSVDTSHADVAEIAIRTGADIINDVCAIVPARAGITLNTAMNALASRLNCPLIAMHNAMGLPGSGNPKSPGANFWQKFLSEMHAGAEKILQCGVPENQLWLDPGFGFGKTPAGNLTLVARLRELAQIGFPVLLGTSRKSTLGTILGNKPIEERAGGDAACAAIGALNGAAALRLHDIATHRDTVKAADAIAKTQNCCAS